MPFTGALDSVLEQHRTAREGILEANMNPAATVKALRAESAPADSKHPKQRLHVCSRLLWSLLPVSSQSQINADAISNQAGGLVVDCLGMLIRSCQQLSFARGRARIRRT